MILHFSQMGFTDGLTFIVAPPSFLSRQMGGFSAFGTAPELAISARNVRTLPL